MPLQAELMQPSAAIKSPALLSLWKGAVRRRLSRREVIAQTAMEHGLTPEDLTGRDRRQRVAEARQEAMWRMWAEGYSFPNIGRALGRDHTTCIYGKDRHEEREALKVAAE